MGEMSKLTVKSKLAAVLIAVMVVVSAVSGWTALFGRASAADNSVKLTYVSPSKIYSDSNKSKDKAKKSSKSDKTAKSKSKQSPKPGNGSSGGAQGEPPSDGHGGSDGQPPAGEKQPPDGQNGAFGQGGGANTQSYDYRGTNKGELTANKKSVTANKKTVNSATADVNALLAKSGGTLTVKNSKVTKSGDDTNGDNVNFYGINSSALAVGKGSKLFISKTSISSTSEGSNGIFSTDKGKVYANDVKITTKNGGNSRGLDATYGGEIYANKMNISTEGNHSAATATDRGRGYISITNSKLKTAGSGSPIVYSTGDIELDAVKGTATGSQIAGIEGKNRILVYNSSLTSTNDAIAGSDPIKNGVIIYQSTSGDAETASSQLGDFEAVNSTLKSTISGGAMFYVTNTNAKVVLKKTKLDFDSANVDLINAGGNNSNNWGSRGNNGGNLTFTGISQVLKGNIAVDTISSVNLYLTKNTTWTGSAKIETNSSGSSSGSPLTVNVDKTSKWVVTKNTAVTNLNAEKGAKIVDSNGKTVTIKVNGKTKVKGNSDVAVTVTGKYSNTVKTSSQSSLSTSVLSREAFDKKYNVKTTFGTNKLS
ncbi:adhesin [Mogibacterium timidum]|uniref:Adhesin n=2 Tax=Mogibacterium timidum TaxID=35519 RepID=A0A7Y9B0V4_9FIRM|nr:adhesin [Mogibacterium timidum]